MINPQHLKMYLKDRGNKTVLDDMWGPCDLNVINGVRIAFTAKSMLYDEGATLTDIVDKILLAMGDSQYFALYQIIEDERKIRFSIPDKGIHF